MAPRRPPSGSPAQWPVFLLVTVVPAAACAVVISWGVCIILGLVPYKVLCPFIAFNNSVAGFVLGIILLPLVYPRALRWRLVYWEIMSEQEVGDSAVAWPAAISATGFSALGLAAAYLMRSASPYANHVPAVATVSALGLLAASALMARWPRTAPADRQSGGELAKRPDVPAIEVRRVTFRYLSASSPALRDVSFTQEPGEMRCVMGATGAGKSTLCLCVSGVIPWLEPGEFSGQVSIFGTPVSGLPARIVASRVGTVLQDFETQLLGSRVETAVAAALENMGLPVSEIEERVTLALQVLGISHLRRRDPTQLSGGEKQRAAIAAALARQPDVVVLDEPTTDLDPAGRDDVAEAWAELRSRGCTLLIAEHAPEVALQADRLTVLSQGEVAFDGPPWELLCDPLRCRQLSVMPAEEAEIAAALGIQPLAAPGLLLDRLSEANAQLVADRLPEAAVTAPTPGDIVVEVCDLVAGYGSGDVLRGVSLAVRQGELLAVLGRNGSGKTTLAKCIDGLLAPTSGSVRVLGHDPSAMPRPEVAKRAGMLFQNPDHQLIAATVREEVELGPRLARIPPQQARENAEWAISVTGLEPVVDADPLALPKGLRQKVALASVLAFRPPLILFDEPTTGLDGTEQLSMMELLTELARSGHAVVMITHAVWAAARYATRVALMADGQVVKDGAPREVFADADALAASGVAPPPSVSISHRLFGQILLSPQEFGMYAKVVGAEDRQ
ncbi:MAG: ABC transporter ATP-binding protein [Armatimonadetes bacterium]|nr:ABC transporter ATP-binding protein [Armatimonadota bacterium]